MSNLTIGREWRLLSQDEFGAISESHLENVANLERGEAVDLLKRLDRLHGKYRDLSHQQRREARNKTLPRSARPATDNANTQTKARVFRKAVIRVKRHIDRIDAEAAREAQIASMTDALAMKKASVGTRGPRGRTSRSGMPVSENATAPRYHHVDREKGRVSAAVKRSQARKDARG